MRSHNSQYPHLAKAPITEAIIDFQVRLPANFDVEKFKAVHAKFERDYPKAKKRSGIQHFVAASQSGLTAYNREDIGVQGYLFRSEDEKNLLQFRKDGFTFNRLEPYTSWERIFPEARRFWDLYLETASPEEISRIAVRYINRIPLPVAFSLGDYLTAPPPIPKNFPDQVMGFVCRVTVRDDESRLSAHIVQALESPSGDSGVTILLDIDVFDDDVSDLDYEQLLARFDALREMKNRIFFSSLTDRAVEMFR